VYHHHDEILNSLSHLTLHCNNTANPGSLVNARATSKSVYLDIIKGWAEYFSLTSMTKPPGGLGGPTHPHPTPFEKTLFSNFGAKVHINGAKIQIMAPKIKYVAPKLKHVAPKFIDLTPNSNA